VLTLPENTLTLTSEQRPASIKLTKAVNGASKSDRIPDTVSTSVRAGVTVHLGSLVAHRGFQRRTEQLFEAATCKNRIRKLLLLLLFLLLLLLLLTLLLLLLLPPPTPPPPQSHIIAIDINSHNVTTY